MPVTHVDTRDVDLAALTPYPGNARRGDIPKIRESVRRLGQYRSLVVRDTGDGALVILAGNNTFLALQAEGGATARCEIVRCDDDEARRINVVDNRLPDLGDYDRVALAEQLSWLDNDFSGTGFLAAEVDEILRSVDFFGNQATAFLQDLTLPPPPPLAALPAPAPAPAAAAAQPAPAAAVPQPGQPPLAAYNPDPVEQPAPPPGPAPAPAGQPVEQYVSLSWTVTTAQRETIRAALRIAQDRNQLATAAEALVAIADYYLENAS